MIKMEQILISTEYINLSQFLKIANLISSGGEAKFFLEEALVYVNEEREKRRGRKLYPGDVIEVNEEKYLICN